MRATPDRDKVYAQAVPKNYLIGFYKAQRKISPIEAAKLADKWFAKDKKSNK